MAKTVSGSCRCGAVSYEIDVEDDPPVYCCHCLDCQKWSGSAFAEQAIVPENSIRVTGPILRAEVTSWQGNQSIQYVCGHCHSRICSTNPKRPGIALLRAGTLAEADHLRPRMHIWIKRKQPWITLPDDVAAFEENAPAEEFMALMQPGRHG